MLEELQHEKCCEQRCVRPFDLAGHMPRPHNLKQVKDMTGGALTWVDATWPGACFAGQGVRYVAVAGRAVRGDRDADRRTLRYGWVGVGGCKSLPTNWCSPCS